MSETMVVNDKAYSVIRLLGKGKGGYSYLATDGRGNTFVLSRALTPHGRKSAVRNYDPPVKNPNLFPLLPAITI